MPANPPVNFQEKVQGPTGTTGKDYPYAIRASDLDKNFVFATLDIDDDLIEQVSGAGNHSQRKLKIDAGTGTNQIYIWNGDKITVINATPTEGSVLVFKDEAFSYVQAPSSGTHVLGSVGGAIQWIETEEC